MYYIVAIIVLTILLLYFLKRESEKFDATGTITDSLNSPYYGLRGERLPTHPIDDCYFDTVNCYVNNERKTFYPPYDPTVRP